MRRTEKDGRGHVRACVRACVRGRATHRHVFVMEMTTQSAGLRSSCTIL